MAAAVAEKGNHPSLASLFENEEKFTRSPPADFSFDHFGKRYTALCT